MAHLTTGASRITPILGAFVVLLSTHVSPSTAASSTGGIGATITTVEGQVEVFVPGRATPIIAGVDMRVEPGSTVRTKSNGRVELQFDDRSLLRLDHDSEIQIIAGDEARGVFVTLGKIWAKVQTALGMSKFQISTPTVVAGVRGTIVRAEVDADSSSIAVDEGEVEVGAPGDDALTILGAAQMVRRDRADGRRLTPGHFDPEARQRWEYWTDPVVQQRIKGIEEAGGEVRRLTEELEENAMGVFQALAVDGQAVKRVAKRVAGADAVVRSVQIALAQGQTQLRPAGRFGARGGTRPGARRPQPPTRAQLLAGLERANRTYTECLPLVGRGRQVLDGHVADLEGLREDYAARQEAIETMKQRLEGFRRRREVDPHWLNFKAGWERCQGHHGAMRSALVKCGSLLNRDVPETLGDDPMVMKAIQHRFVWAFRSLDAAEARINTGQVETQRLHAAIQGGGRIGQ